jgi:hypothetical protein
MGSPVGDDAPGSGGHKGSGDWVQRMSFPEKSQTGLYPQRGLMCMEWLNLHGDRSDFKDCEGDPLF